MNEPEIAILRLRLSTIDLLSAAIEGLDKLGDKPSAAAITLIRRHVKTNLLQSLKGGQQP